MNDGSIKRSPLRYAVSGLAVTALMGGATAVALADNEVPKTVTVNVDGHSRTVRTSGDDVAAALRSAGLTVRPHDVVSPATATPLRDGSTVVLERARPLHLFVNGSERTVWVTQPTIGAAMQALGLRLRGAYLSASRSGRIPLSGTTVLIQLPKRVTIAVDGRRRHLTTTAVTIADVLAERHVRLGALDRVSVPLDRAPRNGLVVRIARVAIHSKHVVLRLGFGTHWIPDSSLYKGTSEVRRDGVMGRADRWYRLTFVDGKLVKRRLVHWHRRSPVARVVAYGTKSHPAPAPVSSSGLDWAALARCESGGNPSVVDPPFYGLYQFMISTWESVGGSGLPSDASVSEQTYRAELLYQRDGRAPWPVCGKYL